MLSRGQRWRHLSLVPDRPPIDNASHVTVPKKMASTAWSRIFGGSALALLLVLALQMVTPAAASLRTGEHFIWRVTTAPSPFYLVGSLHSLKKEDYPLPTAYQDVFGRTERLLFEYDLRRRDTLARKFREAARYPSGQDIQGQVRPSTLAILRRNLWKFGLTFNQVRTYRPWALALRLLNAHGPVGPSSDYSMESYLFQQARRARQEVGGLETVDEHVAFWREMLESDSENLLVYTLVQDERVAKLFARTRAAWKRGDVAAISATSARLRQVNPALAQRLLERRNRRWVEQIEREMKSGKATAIVVGAGHLSGPGSVIALLRERGHRVEQH